MKKFKKILASTAMCVGTGVIVGITLFKISELKEGK